uniref:Uncharacterized protein n=1 Tax=Leersia perrieri TaxID=77586 RepID=A0A0D9WVH3_9ORYZ
MSRRRRRRHPGRTPVLPSGSGASARPRESPGAAFPARRTAFWRACSCGGEEKRLGRRGGAAAARVRPRVAHAEDPSFSPSFGCFTASLRKESFSPKTFLL